MFLTKVGRMVLVDEDKSKVAFNGWGFSNHLIMNPVQAVVERRLVADELESLKDGEASFSDVNFLSSISVPVVGFPSITFDLSMAPMILFNVSAA